LQHFEQHNDVKGNRIFTLLPENGLEPAFVHLDTTSLQRIGAHVARAHVQAEKKRVDAQPKNKIKNQQQPRKRRRVRTSDSENAINNSRTSTDATRRTLWAKHFDLHLLPKQAARGLDFAYSLKTDGLVACVSMERAKSGCEISASNDPDGNCAMENSELEEKKRQENKSANSDSATWRRIHYTRSQRIVGLDPGRRDVFVAVDRHNEVTRCSNGEMQFLSGRLFRQRQVEKWMRSAGLHKIKRLTPSSRVSTVKAYKAHLRYLLSHAQRLLAFHCTLRQRRLRRKTDILRTKALDTVCKRITNGDRRTIVAFGAASFSSSSPGHASTPRKALKERLRQHCALVVDIDENLTSQVCSCCHKRSLVAHHKKTIPVKVRRYNNTTHRASAKPTAEDQVKDGVKPTITVPINGVRVCPNCRIAWNRDVNAARNMLYLFFALNSALGRRPRTFDWRRTPHTISDKAAAAGASSGSGRKKSGKAFLKHK
jgi:hypothetical protein